MKTTLRLLALLVPVCPLAQTVWTVDDTPGPDIDFGDIQAAIDAASDGDVVLVHQGDYDAFTIESKSITVLAALDEEVLVNQAGTARDRVVVRGLLPGQDVVLRGLALRGGVIGFAATQPLVQLEDNLGTVVLEDLEARFVALQAWGPGVTASNSAAVHVARCSFFGRDGVGGIGQGLDAVNSNVTLWASTFEGNTDIGNSGVTGSEGVRVAGGSLFAAGCTLQGGEGGNGTSSPGGDGGDGVRIDGAAAVRLRDCVLAGGAPGAGGSSGAPGLPSRLVLGTLETLPGTQRGLEIQSPLRAGVDPVDLTFTGAGGDLVFLLWSTTGGMPPLYLAVVSGSLTLDLGSLDGMQIGTLDPSGLLSTTAPPPRNRRSRERATALPSRVPTGRGWLLRFGSEPARGLRRDGSGRALTGKPIRSLSRIHQARKEAVRSISSKAFTSRSKK